MGIKQQDIKISRHFRNTGNLTKKKGLPESIDREFNFPSKVGPEYCFGFVLH